MLMHAQGGLKQDRFNPGRDARSADPRLNGLRETWRHLRRALQQLLDVQSAEAVHDTRVHARRLRALLRAVRKETNPTLYATLRFDLVNLGRELAAVRTADAHVRLLRELSGLTRHLGTKDMLTMIALSERRATAARSTLQGRLQSAEWTNRVARIDISVSDPELLLHPARSAGDECRIVLRTELSGAARALKKRKRKAESLHKQRIRLKSARYVCEQFQSFTNCDTRPAVKALNRAQNILGNIHDLHSLSCWIESTPIPHALQNPLLDRVARQERNLLQDFHRRQPALRRRLRKTARDVGAARLGSLAA